MTVETPPPTPEETLVLEIVDALAVVAPRGWQKIDLLLARGAQGNVRVQSLRSHVAVEPPPRRPELGLEPGSLHGVVNEALHDLLTDLGRVEPLPPQVTVDRRDDGTYTVTIASTDTAPERVVTLTTQHTNLLLFTEAFFDALLEVERDFEPKQRALADEIAGHDDFEYDSDTQKLQLKRGVLPWRLLNAVPIGSFSGESEEWLWAWANPSLPRSARDPISAVRIGATPESGLSVLRRPHLPCTEAFAVRISALAAMRLGARGVYGAPFGPGVMMLAVLP